MKKTLLEGMKDLQCIQKEFYHQVKREVEKRKRVVEKRKVKRKRMVEKNKY